MTTYYTPMRLRLNDVNTSDALDAISWESDGGGCMLPVTPQPPRDAQLKLSPHLMGQLLRPICPETEALLAPLRHVGSFDQIEIGVQSDLEHFIVTVFKRYDSDAKTVKRFATGADSPPNRWQWRIPGSHVDTRGRLICPTTDFSVIVLCALWPDDKISFEDDLAKAVFENLAMQWKLYFISAQMQAEYKSEGILPEVSKTFTQPGDMGRTDLAGDLIYAAPYQKCMAACAAVVPGYGYTGEMGTGKTYPAIMRIDHDARKHRERELSRLALDPNYVCRPYRVIIVCPKNVRTNWERELNLFSTLRGRPFILRGTYLDRWKTFADLCATPSSLQDSCGYDWSAMILSYGLLRRDVDKFAFTAERNDKQEPIWDLAICDESHNIKGAKTQQTRAAMILRDSSAKRMIMTGTIMPNRVGEYFPQLEFLGKGFSGFKSLNAWNKFYQHVVEYTTENGQVQQHVTGLTNVPLLKERLARMTFHITKAEALEGLPSKVYDVIDVEMTPEQTQVYERVLDSILVEAERELSGGVSDGRNYNMILQNVLKRMLRLSQITSGFYVSDAMCNDDGEVLQASETHFFEPNVKLDALWEAIKDKPKTSKCLIWACWKHDIAGICALLKMMGKGYVKFDGSTSDADREQAISLFNTDFDTQYWVGNPAAGGVGVNLLGQANEFTNCDHIVYFSQNWRSDVRAQSEDRAHRRGTRCHIRITDLMVPGTIDEQIRQRVLEKRQNSVSVQDIREILGRLAASVGKLRE